MGPGERGEEVQVHGRAAYGTVVSVQRLDQVTVAFGPRTALGAVSLLVPDDARIGVAGPERIGKSTLLRVMAGELAPDEGRCAARPRPAGRAA